MPSNLDFISPVVMTTMTQAIMDTRDLNPISYRWLNRTPVVPTANNEILLTRKGNVFVADLITDDARASIVSGAEYSMETNTALKIKQGRMLKESTIRKIREVERTSNPGGISFEGEVRSEIAANVEGVRQRMEIMCVQMVLDSGSYASGGLSYSGVTWGTPSDLKVVVSTVWTDTVNADGIQDIVNFLETARVRYGKTYNRMTMTWAAWRALIAQAKVIARSKTFLPLNFIFNGVLPQNVNFWNPIISSMLGQEMAIELYDERVQYQKEDGSNVYDRVWPISMIAFSNTADDNQESKRRFAMGETIESVVGSLPFGAGSIVGRFPGPTYGPVSYITPPSNLNPPQFTMWTAAYGFPRKDDKLQFATMNVGTLPEIVPLGQVPFPLA